MKNNLEKIVYQPSYWVEGINGILYNAIVTYMEEKQINQTQLAEVLGVSLGRVSQILNEGDINFSIEKIVEIALKIGKFPVFELEDSIAYLEKLNTNKNLTKTFHLNANELSEESYPIENQNQSVQSFNTYNSLKIAL